MIASWLLLAVTFGAPIEMTSLSEPVEIAIDGRGVPTVMAASMEDALRGEGFIHARDRYFQMDMMRRFASGELAALAGPLVVDFDREARVYRGRATCEAIFESLTAQEQDMLRVYTEGVNAGLASLDSPAPEYGLFNATPVSWTTTDCLLVYMSMFMTLTSGSQVELGRWPLHQHASKDWVDFLLDPTDPRDRPMIPDGSVRPRPVVPPPPRGNKQVPGRGNVDEGFEPGSNNWAVSSRRTRDGGAILANDPHLLISLPGLWYRVRLQCPGVDLMGLSIPGLPGVTFGTNGHVAWGFTNATIDLQDYVIVEVDPDDENQYRVPGGWESFEVFDDSIEVAGGEAVPFTSRWTRWGPTVSEGPDGEPLAVAWTALRPGSVNINITRMAEARDVDEAIEVMRHWHGPPQNVLLADTGGRIGWVLSGWLPARRGFDGRYPVSWADGTRGWEGALDESLRPVVVDPGDGVLYTANNRTVDRERAHLLGSEWASPDRAARIAELLGDRRDLDETDLLEMQLDTAAPRLELYRRLVLESVPTDHVDEQVRVARDHVENWNGRSDANQVGMTILVRYQRSLDRAMRRHLLSNVTLGDGSPSGMDLPAAPLRFMYREQPPDHLPAEYDTWQAMHREAFEQAVAGLVETRGDVELTWGESNRSRFSHLLVNAMPPFLRDRMSINWPQSGYWGSVRVAGSSFGASARLVIDPAHPERAILQTPGGQSGRYDSPHWADFHGEWHAGEPTPLLPGPTVETIELVPG